nr:hypothetical protein [Tanacetum cinerariifolium]
MKEFATEDQANYYSGITCVTINGKRAYELKGKFLNDFLDNAFSGTNGEDGVKHIEYFLKIVDLINLLSVNHERLRLATFPISLIGNASKWFDEIKAKQDPTDTTFEEWNIDHNGVIDDGFSDLEGANNDDEQEIDEIFIIETNLFNYETSLCTKFNEFNYLLKVDPENNETKWPTCNSNEDGFYNGGELPRMVRVGYMTYFQDHEWYDGLMDEILKDEALEQKSIYENS